VKKISIFQKVKSLNYLEKNMEKEKNMKKVFTSVLVVMALTGGILTGCNSSQTAATSESKTETSGAAVTSENAGVDNTGADSAAQKGKTDLADNAFDTSYTPKKDTYKIYCTYKNIHSWYDAIEAGVKAAVRDFEAKGVTIDYEWYAPIEPDAIDQVNSIETAVGQGWDLIAVDVNQPETTIPAINAAVDAGIPVATFASSDLPSSKRAFFVGNNDNYGDGAALAEAVAQKMGGKGQIALLSGTIGAASHEDRLRAFNDVLAKYPDIEVVDEQRDNDYVEKAIQITESWMQAYPDLGGILCNNMSNPVGACQAVVDAGKGGSIIIGGMDHDLRTFNYLKDSSLYVAQVQNCYDMGYKMVYNAVKTVDGEAVETVTNVGSTSVFQDEAAKYIDLLYGK